MSTVTRTAARTEWRPANHVLGQPMSADLAEAPMDEVLYTLTVHLNG